MTMHVVFLHHFYSQFTANDIIDVNPLSLYLCPVFHCIFLNASFLIDRKF